MALGFFWARPHKRHGARDCPTGPLRALSYVFSIAKTIARLLGENIPRNADSSLFSDRKIMEIQKIQNCYLGKISDSDLLKVISSNISANTSANFASTIGFYGKKERVLCKTFSEQILPM